MFLQKVRVHKKKTGFCDFCDFGDFDDFVVFVDFIIKT